MKKIIVKIWCFIRKRFVFGAAGFVVGEGVINFAITISAAVIAFTNGFILIGIGCVVLGTAQLAMPLYLANKAVFKR